MKKIKGFTLVEIMIVVAIIALIASIGIPNLLRAKIQANEDAALAILRTVAVGSENYTNDFSGNYPLNMTSLTGASTPYVDIVHDQCGQTSQGYSFSCTQNATGYTLLATPVELGVTGNKTFTMTTGVVLEETVSSSGQSSSNWIKSDITDTAFQTCITDSIGADNWNAVTQEDLETVTSLTAASCWNGGGAGVVDLAGIGNFLAAEFISLSNQNISTIPASIGELLNLETLTLVNNSISELPDEIWNLTDLTGLNFQGNDFTSIPSEVGTLSDLEILQFSYNDLTSLPAEVGNLTNLTTLHMRENDISSLPTEIGNLTNLTAFDFANNSLTSVPSEIGNFTDLVNFNVGGNNLTSLPSELGDLTNLKTLYLNNNTNLTTIPPASGPTNLAFIYLTGTQITCADAATAGWNATICLD